MHLESFLLDRSGKISHKQETKLAPKVFRQLREDHPQISSQREFTKAGGKNLKQDQRKTSVFLHLLQLLKVKH